MLFLIITIDKGDVLGFGKILPEIVGGSGLNRFFILHHSFYSEGGFSPRETFGLSFLSHYNWDRQ